MTANYELKLQLFGNKEQLKGMLEIIGLYSNKGDKQAYFTMMRVNGEEIDFSKIQDEVISGGTAVVTALGPYGGYAELNDVSIFRDLAEAFPEGVFTAEISGYETYEVQNLKCELRDRMLNIEIFLEYNDEPCDAWKEAVMKKLPLDNFKKLFKIKGDTFDNVSYGYVLESMSADHYYDFFETELDDFVGYLEDINGTTEIEEEEFVEIMKNNLPKLGVESMEEFVEEYDGGYTSCITYDPVKKSYV